MRSNGLTAATYTPVADLEPQLAETILDDLRGEGVAAYTRPVESSTAGGFDRPEFRVGVKERLYVDSAASTRVRDLLESRDPALLDDSEDLRWAQLVAGFDRPLETEVAPWPANEDVSADEGPVVDERDLAARDRGHDTPAAPPAQPFGVGAGGADSADDAFLLSTMRGRADDADDREERFVPEPPPPLPQLPPFKIIAWGGLIGGPLVLIVAAILHLLLPGWVSGFAIVGFVGGFITLVATMGEADEDDADPGNGAVV